MRIDSTSGGVLRIHVCWSDVGSDDDDRVLRVLCMLTDLIYAEAVAVRSET